MLALPDVQERIAVYHEQDAKFKEMVKAHTRVEKDVIISDLRGVDPIYSGNRFLIYSMYPEQNISVWIVNGKGGHGCSAAVGYSVLNRTSNVNGCQTFPAILMLTKAGTAFPKSFVDFETLYRLLSDCQPGHKTSITPECCLVTIR